MVFDFSHFQFSETEVVSDIYNNPSSNSFSLFLFVFFLHDDNKNRQIKSFRVNSWRTQRIYGLYSYIHSLFKFIRVVKSPEFVQ